MKTPSLPKTIKPFNIVSAVKRAIKNDTEPNEIPEIARLRDLFVVYAWAQDFGHEPQDTTGEYYWTPGSSTGAFVRYQKTVKSACSCVEWNLRYPASEKNKELLDFFGRFNVVDAISRLLFEKAEDSKRPEYQGLPVVFKAVSYKFGGDIMKDVPMEYKFQFDVGKDHYLVSVSEDFSELTFSGKSNKTIKSEDFIKELDAIISDHNATEYVDLSAI